jgi:two-component system, LuxR family, sensor kinase FixL
MPIDQTVFMSARERFIRARRSFMALARDALLLAACYVALDWASYIYPLGPFNITPWNPPPALSVVWMMLGGLRYAPVVFIAALVADVLVRHAPGGLAVTVATSMVLAAGYAAIAAALRYFFKSDARLRDTRLLSIFCVLSAVGAALVASLYVGVLWAAGFPVGESYGTAAFRFWLGDTVGILVTAPLLLVAADPGERERLARSWRKPETVLQFTVMIAAAVFVFRTTGEEPSKYFYVLFLPLIWIASRGGLVGATLASGIVQVGVVLGAHGGTVHSLAIVDLQTLVAALTLTGLFLGVMMDERERAGDSLKRSLRLAAAGEMAGAIAHEINQPIAALANYGRACQLILKRDEHHIPRAELESAIERMLGESRRAADVVARLREFFRTGTTQLEAVTAVELLQSARRTGAGLNESGEVAFTVEESEIEPHLMVDRLQIELVLRNLVANAFEAVANQPSGRKQVTVSAHPVEEGRILFRVADSGPGVPSSERGRLFEPFSGSKPKGMGLGLAVSRAIAEAHGGSLTMAPMDQTEFHLVLPSVATDG